MNIAEKYRQTNIIEYVLYMWHIEGLVRTMNLEMDRIDREIISKFDVDVEAKKEIRSWYADIVERMNDERIREEGHLAELNELMAEIHYLHQSLLTVYQDKAYQKLVEEAQPNLEILKQKSGGKKQHSDIELGMNGLFGVLVLKLRGQQVSEGTQEAIQSISKMMAYLAKQYNKMKQGQLGLPKVMEN